MAPDVMSSVTSVETGASAAPKPARLKHIRELDGLRGVAALMVFLLHTASADLIRSAWTGATGMLVGAAAYGYAGVDLFFVLSGFLITSLLLLDRESPRYYQDFYWKRALRILPLFLTVALCVLARTGDTRGFLLTIVFLGNFAGILPIAWQFGPFWSLAIEEQFYLLWPTVIRRLSVNHVQRIAIGVGVSSFLLRLVFAWCHHGNYKMTFLRADGLAFGAVMACHFLKTGYDPSSRRRENLWLTGAVALGLVALAISPACARMPGVRAMLFSWAMLQTGIVLLTGAAVGLAIANSGAKWLGFLRSRMLTFFGLISYALYLVHYQLPELYNRWFAYPKTDAQLYLRMGVVLAVTVGLCLVSRYALELPAVSLRKYVLSRPSTTAEMESPPLPLASM